MAEASIPVDLFNPGQVFACIGFVEVADRILGGAEGAFDWSGAETRFHLRANGDEEPVRRVLGFLEKAEVHAVVPEGSRNIARWEKSSSELKLEVRPRDEGYPFPDPDSPDKVVCILRHGDNIIELDYWGDVTRENMKFWAGMGGMPGAVLAQQLLRLVRNKASHHVKHPFGFGVPRKSSFRLDWRGDYIPIDAGFSLNKHKNQIVSRKYPIVELLGALGLSHARPRRGKDSFEYFYGVVGRDGRNSCLWLSPMFLRAGLGVVELPFPTRRFRMKLDRPGEESCERVITVVTEEED